MLLILHTHTHTLTHTQNTKHQSNGINFLHKMRRKTL